MQKSPKKPTYLSSGCCPFFAGRLKSMQRIAHPRKEQTMAESHHRSKERAFDFLRINRPAAKPRSRGVTEIRGPYYTPMGKHYLQDILETMGAYVDALRFAGGSFALMPRPAIREMIDLSCP
jgi:hypothetical protein